MSGLEEWINIMKPDNMMFEIDLTLPHAMKHVGNLTSNQTNSFRQGDAYCKKKLHLPSSIALNAYMTDGNNHSKPIYSVKQLTIYSETKEMGEGYTLINEFNWVDLETVFYINVSLSVSKFQETLRKIPKLVILYWTNVSILQDDELDLHDNNITYLSFTHVNLAKINASKIVQ